MTGFALKEAAGPGFSVSVEIKGCNGRFLEVSVNAPAWLSGIEATVRQTVAAVCGRGRVDVHIRIREAVPVMRVTANVAVARAYASAISDLARALGIDDTIDIPTLLKMDGVLEAETDPERDLRRYRAALEPVLKDALAAFSAERAREGAHTEADVLFSLGRIEAALAVVAEEVPTLEAAMRESVAAKFRELAVESPGPIDENRILAETALLLTRHTVAEELSRLSAHLGEFRKETERNERPGKKLDFLCQEIGREINTVGSKSTMIRVSRAVVEMKDALENIREQLRNVE